MGRQARGAVPAGVVSCQDDARLSGEALLDALWVPVTGMVPLLRSPLAAGEAVCPLSQRKTEQRHATDASPAIERRLRAGPV